VAWRAATRIEAGAGDLVQRTGDGQAQAGYSVAKRSRGRVMLCAVCTVHKGDEESGFLGLASKPRSTVSPGLASKQVATILVVWPQNHSLRFPGLGLKTGSCGLVIWPTKSPQWFLGLSLKTKWAMVCRLHHKTDRRMKMVQDTR
jgi:hypothetical protein